MITCPYCAAVNWDNTPVCHACGRDLQPSAGAEPTQPVRPQRPQIYDTQSFHNTQPRPYAQEPVSQPGYLPPDNPPPPPPPGGPPQPPAPRGSDKPWIALLLGLVVVLVAGCALALFTISAVTAGGINRLSANVSTQVADIFASPTAGPAQTEPAPFVTPTPWPTFTPQPTDPPSPTPLPTDTQPPPTATAAAEPTRPTTADSPLLSPQCAAALDTLSRLSEEITTRPTAPLDPTWRSDITQAIADVRTNCGSLDSASPVPGIVGSAERNLALALDEFDEAARLFGEGVSEVSPAKILEAGQHIQKAAGYLNQAIAELRKIDGNP